MPATNQRQFPFPIIYQTKKSFHFQIVFSSLFSKQTHTHFQLLLPVLSTATTKKTMAAPNQDQVIKIFRNLFNFKITGGH